MNIGITIPMRGPLASAASIRELVVNAERLGFNHLAVSDHLVVPGHIESTYPYSEKGDWPGAAGGDCMEQFTLLTWVAAISHSAKLVTSVAVVPYRGAVHTAKIAATIDTLSGGRMVLGAGAGWMAEEFVAVGTPPFAARGKVTDEYLQAMRILWTEDKPSFHGEFVDFDNITFLPRGVSKPHPPIWVGGESKAAMRRAVRYGDAWYPIGINPRHMLDTPQRITDGVSRLHQVAQEYDRDPASVGLAYCVTSFQERQAVTTDTGERRILTGGASDLIEDIQWLQAHGFTDLILSFARPTLELSIESMQWFVSEVRKHCS